MGKEIDESRMGKEIDESRMGKEIRILLYADWNVHGAIGDQRYTSVHCATVKRKHTANL